MTMFASKISDHSNNIKVGITAGSVSVSIEENYGHLRGFHSELGRLLDELEKKNGTS